MRSVYMNFKCERAKMYTHQSSYSKKVPRENNDENKERGPCPKTEGNATASQQRAIHMH